MRLHALAALLAVLSSTGSVRAAAPPLVVFFSPDSTRPEAVAARAAVGRVAASLGLAVVDLSAPPPAPPRASALTRRAIEAYDALRYDEALAALDEALAEAARTGAWGLDRADLSDLLLYRGLVHAQRGDQARAWEEFVRAAAVHPARVLDPLRFPPRTVASYQRAAREAQAMPRGEISVEGNPGCSIHVDGVERVPPVSLAYGEHWIHVACPGAVPRGGAVTLSEPRRLVKFVAPPVAVPSEAELVQLARERGAAAVVRIVLATGPATLSLSRLEAATGRVEARQVIPLDDAEGGLRRFLDRSSVPVEALPRPAPPRAPTRWYRSPWFWGAVGVVATALVLTPFLLDGGGDGVDVRPAGDVPWP